MSRIGSRVAGGWMRVAPRFLPFADVASADLSMARLLRLSLFQVSVGMAIVLLIGTMNRVMIVELGVPAWLVAVMVALPLIFAPMRALIGYRSDTHVSALGWRRVPYLWIGTMLQFGGLAIMPFALIVLSGDSNGPAWIGDAGAGLAFLLVGAGMHTVQTVGLALATDLAPAHKQGRVVTLMCAMLLLGMVVSALVFGVALRHFSEVRLIQVIQGSAVGTLFLNAIALWKQEARDPSRAGARREASFADAWRGFNQGKGARRRLVAVGLGTSAFSMQDILLEPYGGQILHLPVGTTTSLTALLAVGGVCGFLLSSRMLDRDADPFRIAALGTLAGLVAFVAVIFAEPLASAGVFAIGTWAIGFGAALFVVGTLKASIRAAPAGQSGLALGTWGAVQAFAAGGAIALGGVLRDVVGGAAEHGLFGAALAGPVTGYSFVYHFEIVLLFATLVAIGPLVRGRQAGMVGGIDAGARDPSLSLQRSSFSPGS